MSKYYENKKINKFLKINECNIYNIKKRNQLGFKNYFLKLKSFIKFFYL